MSKIHNEQNTNLLNKGRPVTESHGAILKPDAKGKISNVDADIDLAVVFPASILSVYPMADSKIISNNNTFLKARRQENHSYTTPNGTTFLSTQLSRGN